MEIVTLKEVFVENLNFFARTEIPAVSFSAVLNKRCGEMVP